MLEDQISHLQAIDNLLLQVNEAERIDVLQNTERVF